MDTNGALLSSGESLAVSVCRGRPGLAVGLALVVFLATSCDGGSRAASEVGLPDSGQLPVPTGSSLGESGRRSVRISDPAGDLFDHEGQLSKESPGVDLVEVVVTVDDSKLMVIFTCAGNVPLTSGSGMYLKGQDAMKWEADFWFGQNQDDMRRYFQATAKLVGRELRGEVAILVGPNKGLFKLNDVPKRKGNRITLTIPWDVPITATKVQGREVSLPRPPTPVFVGAGTKWDHYVSPDDLYGLSNGGDKAPDKGERVVLGA